MTNTLGSVRRYKLGPLLITMTLALSASVEAAGKPNFIVILSDDQSWVGSSQQMIDDDPETRSDYFQTPNIERIARMGMRFTQGYSPASTCCPTRRALQTGQVTDAPDDWMPWNYRAVVEADVLVEA